MSNAINFATFLKKTGSTGFVVPSSVVCFLGTTYPLLFFVQLRTQIQRAYDGQIETINVKEIDSSLLQAQLQTSFLGNSVVYFLRDFDSLERKKQRELLIFLDTYRGPNQVCFFLSRDLQHRPADLWTVVELAQTVDKKLFVSLITWHGIPLSSRIKEFITSLFAQHDTVPLDTACLLLNYVLLMGTQLKTFFSDWLENIIASEQSLFALSQYFFQKDADAFLAQWRQISDVYGSPFWVSFWSEQLWRASSFVMLSKKKQFAQARKIAFRLPFSFINRDWKKYGSPELNNAHHFIYELDYSLKNGGNSFGLDLFYSKFFLNNFA